MFKIFNYGMVTCVSCDGNDFTDDRQRNGKASEQDEKIRRYTMKFFMIVLAVHFVAEMISHKRKDNDDADERKEKAIHPAEFNIR